MGVKNGASGTAETLREERFQEAENLVEHAARFLRESPDSASVQTHVSLVGGVRVVWTTSSLDASFAENLFALADSMGCGHAAGDAVRLLGYRMAGFADVYDLEVEDAHEFFANGILVHNCLRYGLKSMLAPGKKPIQVEAREAWQEMTERSLSHTEKAIQMRRMEHTQRMRGRRRSAWAR
jgi:hypothetical protein